MLRVENLTKTYAGNPPIRALDDVTFHVASGTVSALIGPNGAGKTTVASCLVGLVKPDSGTATLDGIDLLRGPDSVRVGYAPQEEALYPIMRVEENLRLFAELAGLNGAGLHAEINRVAEAFLITDLLHRPVRDLSGGQRRRVHNAIALLGQPNLIILDEPTAGVDPSTRSAILEVVRDTARESDVPVIYSTHYLAEVSQLDAHVTFLDRGRTIAHGSVAELLREHGQDAIEVQFDGPAPSNVLRELQAQAVGEFLRINIADPRRHLGRVVAGLGDHTDRIRSIDVRESELDDVFFRLTGRRYDEEGVGP